MLDESGNLPAVFAFVEAIEDNNKRSAAKGKSKSVPFDSIDWCVNEVLEPGAERGGSCKQPGIRVSRGPNGRRCRRNRRGNLAGNCSRKP